MQRVSRFLTAGLLAACCGGARADEIAWTTDVRRALEEAHTSARPAMVDIWAVWCVPCKKMDETTYRDAAVVSAAAGFVPLKVDADVQEVFLQRYRVEVFPTILFLDGSGLEIVRLEGLVLPAALLETLQRVREGYDRYLDAMTRPAEPAAVEVAGDYLVRAGNPAGAGEMLRRALGRLEKGDPARGRLELRQAEARLAAGELRQAASSFERLVRDSTDDGLRGRALLGLVRAERERGKHAEAERALVRLRSEFPALAEELTPARP